MLNEEEIRYTEKYIDIKRKLSNAFTQPYFSYGFTLDMATQSSQDPDLCVCMCVFRQNKSNNLCHVKIAPQHYGTTH